MHSREASRFSLPQPFPVTSDSNDAQAGTSSSRAPPGKAAVTRGGEKTGTAAHSSPQQGHTANIIRSTLRAPLMDVQVWRRFGKNSLLFILFLLEAHISVISYAIHRFLSCPVFLVVPIRITPLMA